VLGGEIPESGFIFKDTINVEAFEDPMVSGVTVYISEIARFGAVPPIPGLTCAKSGPVKIAADLKANNEVEDVFTEARSPLSIRDLRVKRVYDADAKNIVYVAVDSSSTKSQACAVHVDGFQEK